MDVNWLGREDAARILGVSVRQVEKRASQGHIRKRTLDRLAHERTARVEYLREDVDRLRSGVLPNHGTVVREKPKPASAGLIDEKTALTPASPQMAGNASWQEFCRAVAGAIAPRPEPKPWLTLREASEYSGLPVGYLRRVAARGDFGAIDVSFEGSKKRAWRFRRAAF